MRLQIMAIIKLMVGVWFMSSTGSQAFTVISSSPSSVSSRTRIMTSRPLRMSDIPQDDNNNNDDIVDKSKSFIRNALPPAPEDQFTMIGDIASLFLYGLINHVVNSALVKDVIDNSPSAEVAAKTLDPNGSYLVTGAVPVWVDTTIPSTTTMESVDHIMRLGIQDKMMPTYAPVLSTMGTACVSLAVCWLLAGYINQAFCFRNTLDCNTHHVVKVAGKTWILSSIFMLILTCSSRYILEGSLSYVDDYATASGMLQMLLGTITFSDADFISNSLGVILTWRVMISYLLGGWRN